MDPARDINLNVREFGIEAGYEMMFIIQDGEFLDRGRLDLQERQMGERTDKLTATMAAETEILKEAYAALNRGDVPGFVRDFDAEIERIEFIELPQGGTYQGIAAVTDHVTKGRGTWAEGSCEPKRFVVASDKIIAIIDVLVRLKTETEWREGRVADGFTFRNGKVIQFRTFSTERQALEWAGVEDTDASKRA